MSSSFRFVPFHFVRSASQGTSDKLLEHLVEDHTFADQMYIEDFLLSSRVFLKQPERILEKCIEWYRYAYAFAMSNTDR